jgi:rod shape determining protein RodA
MSNFLSKDWILNLSIFLLIVLSVFVLNVISPSLFPSYFVYIVLGLIAFWFFSQVGFNSSRVFAKHFYVLSIILLLLTLVIGRVTRGTIRWIPIGSFSFQPAEIVRPLLLVFFADILTQKTLTSKKLWQAIALAAFPAFLILVQPSLGVSVLTVVGFFGVLLASSLNKKYILIGAIVVLAAVPVFWQVMRPYQKERVMTFLEPQRDPLGAGYNSIQSMIAVGAEELFGRGLGRGVQTQLAFLPEKQSDFIFAATSEELGFLGAMFLIGVTFLVLWRLTVFMEHSESPTGRAYLSGFFLTYFFQVVIHIGMNLGILPVTGIPLPLVSAGGSSFLGTMIGLGIALGAYKK